MNENEVHPVEDVPMRTCSCASKRPPGPGDTCSKCGHAKAKHRPDYRGCTERVPVDSVGPFLARGGRAEDEEPTAYARRVETIGLPPCPPPGTVLQAHGSARIFVVLDVEEGTEPYLDLTGSTAAEAWSSVLVNYGPLHVIGIVVPT